MLGVSSVLISAAAQDLSFWCVGHESDKENPSAGALRQAVGDLSGPVWSCAERMESDRYPWLIDCA